jgi:hypothetical protein
MKQAHSNRAVDPRQTVQNRHARARPWHPRFGAARGVVDGRTKSGHDVERAIGAALLLSLAVTVAAAPAQQMNDLREFHVGMALADLPAHGYGAFACAAAPDHKLQSWSQYEECPADAAGRHEVGFRYNLDDVPMANLNEGYNGTRVGGHPVVVSLLIGDDARVDAIRIDTDPNARLYLRKKAFLFAEQVKERYGRDGWVCREGQPNATEQPVGGIFVKEHCEKLTAGRHLVLDRELYRNPDQELGKFVGGTQLLIERRG